MWYKKAQLINITSFLMDALRNARSYLHGSDMQVFKSNLDNLTGGITPQEDLLNSLNSAVASIQYHQGGYLTLDQNSFVESVKKMFSIYPLTREEANEFNDPDMLAEYGIYSQENEQAA